MNPFLKSTNRSNNRCRGIKPPQGGRNRTILGSNTNNFQQRVCLASSCCVALSQISRKAMRNAEELWRTFHHHCPHREQIAHVHCVQTCQTFPDIPGVIIASGTSSGRHCSALLFTPDDGLNTSVSVSELASLSLPATSETIESVSPSSIATASTWCAAVTWAKAAGTVVCTTPDDVPTSKLTSSWSANTECLLLDRDRSWLERGVLSGKPGTNATLHTNGAAFAPWSSTREINCAPANTSDWVPDTSRNLLGRGRSKSCFTTLATLPKLALPSEGTATSTDPDSWPTQMTSS